MLWIVEAAAAREAGLPYGVGLDRFGCDSTRLIVVRVRKPGDALWVFEEGLACRGLAAVLTEIRGTPRLLDLTASRRLALRAEAGGVMGLLLRQTGEADPSAALTRWRVAPLPAVDPRRLSRRHRPAGLAADAGTQPPRPPPAPSTWSGIMTDAPSPPPRPSARRMLALSLPYLPTDRILRQLNGRSWRDPSNVAENKESCRGGAPVPAPLAVVAKVKSALRLVALDETAERLGLPRGQALADARAMIPALGVADDDPAADPRSSS